MKCPYCLTNLQPDPHAYQHAQDKIGVWDIHSGVCPSCNRTMILLTTANTATEVPHIEIQAWGKEVPRSELPPEVIEPYLSDFYEACFVLADSPRASAALSRRCLQALLRDKADVKPSDLSNEIDQVLASKALAPELASSLAATLDVGNFAANPVKNSHPGVIAAVEPGEAEHLLDVLEVLFDFYLVRPARLKGEDAVPTEAPSEIRARFMKRIVTYISAASRD
ncbi:MAG: DUF4145 domain-containing protein [Alphaproteobacteria bacterium]